MNNPLTPVEEGSGPICCLCYDEAGNDLRAAPCNEKPELLVGVPLGMYHCPDCGAMLCAGFEHGPMCEQCATGTAERMSHD